MHYHEKIRWGIFLFAVIAISGYLVYTSFSAGNDFKTIAATFESTNSQYASNGAEIMEAIVLTNKGTFVIELFENKMPITADNFAKLAEDGFYNGTRFHRVIDGFMIQGGDPKSKDLALKNEWGTGGSATIKDEFHQGLSNMRGTIAMANTGAPDSGSSQFFINLVDNTRLDFDKPPFTSKHPVFGKIVSGMDVVDAIGKTDTGPGDQPIDDVIIENIAIEKTVRLFR